MKRKLAIAIVASMAGIFACAPVENSVEQRDFIVKAGVMEPKNDGVDRLRETGTVTMNPERIPGWCFIVDPPDNEPYEIYSVHYLPEDPQNLTGEFADQQESIDGYKTDMSRAEGIQPFCFDFHEGDPLGEYRADVFINGTLKAELRIQVVAQITE